MSILEHHLDTTIPACGQHEDPTWARLGCMEPSFGRCVYVPKGGAIYRHFSQTQQLWRSWPAAAARTRRHEVVCSPRHLANRRERRAKAKAKGLPLAASSVAFLGCCLCIAPHSIRCCSCSATGQLTMPVRKYFLSPALVDQTCSTMGRVQRPRKLHAQAPHKKHVHRSWPTMVHVSSFHF